MPIFSGVESEIQEVVEAAKLMLLSARTAPKAKGEDDILTALATGKEKDAIADEIERIGTARSNPMWKRDAQNVRDSAAVLLLGASTLKSIGIPCGACGYSSCKDYEAAEKKRGPDFMGPMCIFKLLDLGIALGSAAKTASILNLDNRLMYRAGVAAMQLGLLPKADIIIGIPVSAQGKSIYFDRKT